MPVTIAGEEIKINANTCKNILRGKMMTLGCLINAKTKAYKRNSIVSVFPMRAKKYPVLVKDEKLVDLTTDAGKWERVYTYVIQK